MPQSPDDLAAEILARFRARVFADPALIETLSPIQEEDAFLERASAMAGALALPEEPLRLGLAQWLGTPARIPPPVSHDFAPQTGWLPAKVVETADGATIDWAWLGDMPLTDPFFEDSLQRVRGRPFNRVFRLRTPLAELDRWRTLPHRAPDGLIFHMSRCGSTLAAQMLAGVERYIAVSEAPALDAVVRRGEVGALRAMAAALGQRRRGKEIAHVLKLDCWHIRSFDLFRRAFPDTPWVFLYREPVEVMVSHRREAGRQMAPDIVPPAIFGLQHPAVPDDDYRARLLASLLAAAAGAHGQGGGRLIAYRDLPGAVFDTLLPHFGLAPTGAERTRMERAAGQNAKAPGAGFVPDAARKRADATLDVLAACAAHTAAPYAALEALRTPQARRFETLG